MKILNGITGILDGRKMTMGLLVFSASFVALMTGHLGGVEFAAIVSTICTVLFASHAYQQANMPPPSLPPKGSL